MIDALTNSGGTVEFKKDLTESQNNKISNNGNTCISDFFTSLHSPKNFISLAHLPASLQPHLCGTFWPAQVEPGERSKSVLFNNSNKKQLFYLRTRRVFLIWGWRVNIAPRRKKTAYEGVQDCIPNMQQLLRTRMIVTTWISVITVPK